MFICLSRVDQSKIYNQPLRHWLRKKQIIPLQSDLVADDIDAYIHAKVNQMDRWRDRPAIQLLITNTLKDNANGMYVSTCDL